MNLVPLGNVVAALVFAFIGIFIFIIAFIVMDKLTPYHLWKEIVQEHNMALAILVAPCLSASASSLLPRSTSLWASWYSFRPAGRGLRLIYELVAGTLASYLVGDSVFQFSTIIGTYLFAMGVGSALSRYINRGLANRFIWIELLLGVIGGFSSALLMLAFAFTQGFELILYAVVIVMGVLVGLEIPLLMRIVRDRYQFRDVIAHVLTFDYLARWELHSCFRFCWCRASV